MRAWIDEDGVLVLNSENTAEHEYLRQHLVGRTLRGCELGIIGVGITSCFVIAPDNAAEPLPARHVQKVRTPEKPA